jgi:drug/metabolite transporter (DMT)-like permease
MQADSAPDRPSDPLRGILLMCLGVSLFPLLNACAKFLNIEGYPIPEIVWARFTGHFLFVAAAFLPKRGLRLFAARRPVLQIGRSLFLLGSTAFFISAIGRVPLATASTIGFTTPLLVTALSVPLLRDPVGWRRWSAVAVGFAGALVIIRPGAGLNDPAVLVLLGAAAFYALYQIATRRGGAYDSAETGIVYAALVGTIASTLVVPFVFEAPRSLRDLFLFLGLGLFGGFGHYFVTRAFQHAPAAVISPLGYVELLGTTILGYLIFDNFPDAWTWVGAAIIIASGIYIALRERRLRAAAR